MATYFMLVHFTDQGIRDINDTIGRAEAFQAMAKKSGRAPQGALLDHGPL